METVAPAYGTATLLLIAAGAVVVLLTLILRFRLHAFVALVLVSVRRQRPWDGEVIEQRRVLAHRNR